MNSHSQLISAWQQGRCAKNTTEGNVLEMRQGPSLSIPCQQSSSLIFVVHYAFMNDLAHQYSQFHYRNYQRSERISLLRNNLSKLPFFKAHYVLCQLPWEQMSMCPVKYSVIGSLRWMIFIYLWFMIYYYAFCSSLTPRDKRFVYQQTITQPISAEGEVNIYVVLWGLCLQQKGSLRQCHGFTVHSKLYLEYYESYESYLHAPFLCPHTCSCSWIILDVTIR